MPGDCGHARDVRAEVSTGEAPASTCGVAFRDVRDDHRSTRRVSEQSNRIHTTRVPAATRPEVDVSAGRQARGDIGRGHGAEQVPTRCGEDQAWQAGRHPFAFFPLETFPYARRPVPSGRKDEKYANEVTRDPAAQAPAYSTTGVLARRLPGGDEGEEILAVEEPLEIRIGGEPVAVTMRTPGHDEELALGFCLTEGLTPLTARVPDDLAANTVDVDATGFDPERLRRHFYTSSSCGVCGKGAIEAVRVDAPRVESELQVSEALVASLPDRLLEAQRAFAATGGLHATGLFSTEGELLCVREDVGRHNALDKVVGWAFREGMLPLADRVLCVSGRLSFELVQKASVAGCPIMVAVGAPSSLAVELAQDRGVTLCGFVRDGRATVYTEPWRILS